MKENREWNPCYMNVPWSVNPERRVYPWLYPYGNQLSYLTLWDEPERMEDEIDTRRLREMYPKMAKRLQPYVEEVCSSLEYPGSMMYDEYPDQLSLYRKAKEVWDSAQTGEDWDKLQDLIGVLLLQEMLRRRKKKRERFGRRMY